MTRNGPQGATPSVADVAAARGLGRAVSTHVATTSQALGALLGPLVGLGFCGVLGYYGLVGVLASPVGGPWFWVAGLMAVVFLPAALCGLLLVPRALARRGSALHVFEAGMVHAPRGGAPQVFPWRDIWVLANVQQTLDRYTGRVSAVRSTHTVTAPGGPTVQVDDTFPDCVDLGRHIEEQVLAAQYAPALAQVQAGGTVGFGPLTLDGIGIHHRGRTVRWADAPTATFSPRSGLVEVRGTGPVPILVRSLNVPNLRVVLALVEAVRRGA